jgi:hypothetical protein
MTLASHDLRPVDRSDQRLPCSVIECRAKARFRVTPTCSHDETDWPTRQACHGHLSRLLLILQRNRCSHVTANRVAVRVL